MLIFCTVPADVGNNDLLDKYLSGIAEGDTASLERLYDAVGHRYMPMPYLF